jgi:hypothetical protein
MNRWRELFRGSESTPAVLKDAEVLLNRLSGESPIRIRLAIELEELWKRSQAGKKKRSNGQK